MDETSRALWVLAHSQWPVSVTVKSDLCYTLHRTGPVGWWFHSESRVHLFQYVCQRCFVLGLAFRARSCVPSMWILGFSVTIVAPTRRPGICKTTPMQLGSPARIAACGPGVLPPALGPLPSGQLSLSSEIRDAVWVVVVSNAAQGAIRSFGDLLKSMIPGIASGPGFGLTPDSCQRRILRLPWGPSLLGPKSVSRITAQAIVWRNYEELVRVAVARWRVGRGARAVLD